MAGTATPIFPNTVKNYAAQILPADTSTFKTLVTGGAYGTRVDAITVASTDTSNRDLQFVLNNGSTNHLLFTVQVLANAGNTNAIAALDALRSTMIPGLAYDANGNRYLLVASGWTLKVASTATVTAAKQIDVVATSAGDY